MPIKTDGKWTNKRRGRPRPWGADCRRPRGDQVKYHRDKLDAQSNYLADLSYLTFALQFIPGSGKAMKAGDRGGRGGAALEICSLELYELSREVTQNSGRTPASGQSVRGRGASGAR